MMTYVGKDEASAYAGISYLPNGMVGNVLHANGLNETTVPDVSGMPRPCAIFAYDTSSTSLVSDAAADCGKRIASTSTINWTTGAYAYDGSGNITRIGTKSYLHDTVNRLVSERDLRDTPESYYDYTATFQYDVFGNMTQRTYAKQARNNCAFCDGRIFRMTVPINIDATTNRLISTGYDASGNLVQDASPTPAGTTYAWDAVGTMRSVTSGAGETHYLYDASDERSAIVTRPNVGIATTTWTVRGVDHKLLRTFTSIPSGGGWVWQEDQIWRGGLLLANESPTGTKHFALDHLGSPRAITAAGSVLLSTIELSAFGSVVLPVRERCSSPATSGTRFLGAPHWITCTRGTTAPRLRDSFLLIQARTSDAHCARHKHGALIFTR